MEKEENTPVAGAIPRVVIVGLASCFGCQLQITNDERHLTDVLGQIDLRYWQLASSEEMPSDFDVAVIEGAVTTAEAVEVVQSLRERARVVIAAGTCAVCGGIPGMAATGLDARAADVYGCVPAACGDMIAARPVSAIIDVDFEVRACPIEPAEFVDVLQRVLHGSNKFAATSVLCGECKRGGTDCFFGSSQLCLGLVTQAGCGAKCPGLGRPCSGCRGTSADANLDSARAVCANYGVPVADFDEALELFGCASLAEQQE